MLHEHKVFFSPWNVSWVNMLSVICESRNSTLLILFSEAHKHYLSFLWDTLICCYLTIRFTLYLAKACSTSLQQLLFENINGKSCIKKILYLSPCLSSVRFFSQHTYRAEGQMLLHVASHASTSRNKMKRKGWCLKIVSHVYFQVNTGFIYNMTKILWITCYIL